MDIYAEIVCPAIDEMRRLFPDGDEIQKSPETPLFGPKAALDSLGLVNFVLLVEEKIEALTARRIRLVTDKAMSRRESPFRTVGALVRYIEECLQKKSDD